MLDEKTAMYTFFKISCHHTFETTNNFQLRLPRNNNNVVMTMDFLIELVDQIPLGTLPRMRAKRQFFENLPTKKALKNRCTLKTRLHKPAHSKLRCSFQRKIKKLNETKTTTERLPFFPITQEGRYQPGRLNIALYSNNCSKKDQGYTHQNEKDRQQQIIGHRSE